MSGAAGARRSTADRVAIRSALTHAVKGDCPKCGAPTLFAGWVKFAPECGACGLDFTAFNVGDGPAAFLILIVGAILTVGAIMVELRWSPPYGVHIIWVPIGVGLTLAGLRLGKSLLIAQEYRHRSGEGRLAE